MTRKRSGFTLIELLVVMGILMFLFGLGIAILPGIYQKWETLKGAEMVQAALARARQESRRSGRPTGIRFAPGAGGSISNLKLIQQPIDATGAAAPAGGYLIPEGAGLPTLAPIGNTRYFVVRPPVEIAGEREIMLPEKVGVDLAQSSIDGQNPGGLTPDPVTGFVDIVFGSGGGLTMNAWPGDKIILYVRDTKLTDVTKGYPSLICVTVRTGFIAAHPVDVGGANKYSFCNDPRSSGL